MQEQEKNKKFHKAKKSLGQNFLKSVLALNEIIKAGEVKEGDIILEIGPGKGALTEKILEAGGIVFAVEKDKDLINLLQEKFQKYIENKRFFLVEGDILEIDMSVFQNKNFSKSLEKETKNNFLRGPRFSSLNARPDHPKKFFSFPYKLIANIPYNITGAILKKFLTEENKPERMVLMIQNEVAQRIVARDKKESLLSISIKAYGEPKIVMKVSKRYFSPSPKVDSAIISIKNISDKLFTINKIDQEKFWEILHLGFGHKRKVLLSNLKNSNLEIDFEKIFQKNNIKDKARAEELNINDWINILKDINTQN